MSLPKQETVTTPPSDATTKGPVSSAPSSSGSVVEVVLGVVVEVVGDDDRTVVEVVEPELSDVEVLVSLAVVEVVSTTVVVELMLASEAWSWLGVDVGGESESVGVSLSTVVVGVALIGRSFTWAPTRLIAE